MTVRLGVVGFGIMGERLARAALEHDGVRIAAVWDPSTAAAARLNGVAPTVPMLNSAKEVIAQCDVLYVASPPSSHIQHAQAAMDADKAVFLEKPLAADLQAARDFVALAEQRRARAAVNFPMASSLAVEQLSAWRRTLGTPRSLSIGLAFATWPRGWQQAAAPWLARRAEGGFTREVMSHFLFLTRRQLGALTLMSRDARFPAGDGAEEAVAATLTAGSVPVEISGEVGKTTADDHNLWTLHCEGGAVRLRDWSFAERQEADGSWQPAPDALPNEKMRPLVLKRQLDKVAALASGQPQDLATLREALDVQEIAEAILGL